MDFDEFKEIQNYSRYLVSPSGEVWDIKLQKLVQWMENGSFMCVNMVSDENKKSLIKIHRLVFSVFNPGVTFTKLRHEDGNKLNNHFTNIQPAGINRNVLSCENKKIYSKWFSIVDRCTNSTHKYFPYYGGIGITVCDEWLEYEKFLNWYTKNGIPGWEIDKDLLALARGKESKEYGVETCCFIPDYINQWFGRLTYDPKIRERKNTFSMMLSSVSNGVKVKSYISSQTKDGLIKDYCNFKNSHLRQLIERMVMDWDNQNIQGSIPTINEEALKFLIDFRMENFIKLP